MNKLVLSLLLIILISFTACNSTIQNPEMVVQTYLNALVKKDAATMISLSCKGWETEVQKELDSFMNVGTSLEEINCNLKSQTNSDASVVCKGYIRLTYDTEIQKIDLSKRIYQLTIQDNSWRICNFK